MTPSNRSGALPSDHRVDLRPVGAGVGQRAVDRLAAQPGHRHVGAPAAVLASARCRARRPGAGPLIAPPSHRRGSAAGRRRWWRGPPRGRASPEMICRGGRADPGQAGGEHRVAAEHTAGRVDPLRSRPRRAPGRSSDLLVRERRVQLDDVQRTVAEAGRRRGVGGRAGRWSGRACPSPGESTRCAKPEIHAGRSHSSRARFTAARTIGRRAVADRRAVVRPQRVGDVRGVEQLVDVHAPGDLGLRVLRRGGAAAHRDLGHVPLAEQSRPRGRARACRAAMLTESGHSGAST